MIPLAKTGTYRCLPSDFDRFCPIDPPDTRRSSTKAHQAQNSEPAPEVDDYVAGPDCLLDGLPEKLRPRRVGNVPIMLVQSSAQRPKAPCSERNGGLSLLTRNPKQGIIDASIVVGSD